MRLDPGRDADVTGLGHEPGDPLAGAPPTLVLRTASGWTPGEPDERRDPVMPWDRTNATLGYKPLTAGAWSCTRRDLGGSCCSTGTIEAGLWSRPFVESRSSGRLERGRRFSLGHVRPGRRQGAIFGASLLWSRSPSSPSGLERPPMTAGLVAELCPSRVPPLPELGRLPFGLLEEPPAIPDSPFPKARLRYPCG